MFYPNEQANAGSGGTDEDLNDDSELTESDFEVDEDDDDSGSDDELEEELEEEAQNDVDA